jgi:hypothetical protein
MQMTRIKDVISRKVCVKIDGIDNDYERTSQNKLAVDLLVNSFS